MKEGWFALQALAWAAACFTMKNSDLRDNVEPTSASGTELENPMALRRFGAETGDKMGRAALRKVTVADPR